MKAREVRIMKMSKYRQDEVSDNIWIPGLISGCGRSRESGSIIVLLAVSMIVMFAFLGLVVDGGNIYLAYNKMSKAADAAALAAAIEMPDREKAGEAALEYASLNGFTNGLDTNVVTMYQKPDSDNPNWIYVGMQRQQPVYFMRVLGFDRFSISLDAASVYYSFLPMSINGAGIYGLNGIQYLCAFGENGLKTYGDPYSVKWKNDGTPNPEYNPKGYNYTLDVAENYADVNGTSAMMVEIYDADCAAGLDENHTTAYALGHPPVNGGPTTTKFSVYAPDDTPNNYDDDILVASWTWKPGMSIEDTDMAWYCPPGFSFDTSTHGTGKYRFNVITGDGCANNVYNLRSGPPRAPKGGEIGAAQSNPVISGTFVMQFEAYDWDNLSKAKKPIDEVQIIIDGAAYGNYSSFGIMTPNDTWTPLSIDITDKITRTNPVITLKDVARFMYEGKVSDWNNDIRNVRVLKDGVVIIDQPMEYDIKPDGGVDYTFQAADNPAPVYTLEFAAHDWDTAGECQVYFNSNLLNWEAQGLTANDSTRTFSFDVSDFVSGDKGYVAVIDNTNTLGNWYNKMVLKKDGAVVWEYVDSNPVESSAIPDIRKHSGLGSDAGWGENTQFNPFNGSSIAGVSGMQMQFDKSGTVNVMLGQVPPEAAGVNLHIQKFDTDVGAKSILFWDELGNSWPGTLSGNGTWMEDVIKMPSGYAGSTLYATYAAGAGDTSTWYMWFENSMQGMPGKVRLVK